MSISRVSQGHKVAVVIAEEEDSPVRVTQGHKVMLFNPGTSPVRVSQGHVVVLFQPAPVIADERRRGFMNYST
jgi:hypothetical protein